MDEGKQATLIYIEDYFKKWTKDLEKTKEILSSADLLPQWLILMCCYIDAFSKLRYPGHDNNKAFKLLVLEYSGEKEFYSQIDLFFLYEIDKFGLDKRKPFKKLSNRETIKKILENNFEGMGKYNAKTSYQSSTVVLDAIRSSRAEGIDMQNIECHIEDYTLASFLYHVIRCSAVHEYDFPALIKYYQPRNNFHGYRSNHILTPEIIWKTLCNILVRLKSECLAKCKFPEEPFL